MELKILRSYDKDGYNIIEYTNDNLNVFYIEKKIIQNIEIDENKELGPTIEEQILTETKYQTVLLEMSTGF